MCVLTLLTSAEEHDFAQKGRVESQEVALGRMAGRSKLEEETISGKGKNIRQWVGCKRSVGKCRKKELSDETPSEEEQNPKRNAMLLIFLFFDVKTTPKTFNMPSS